MTDLDELRFSVKYPFTSEAKERLKDMDLKKVPDEILAQASERIKQAFKKDSNLQERIREINSSKEPYLMNELLMYPISNILVSLSGDGFIKRTYARNQSTKVYQSLQLDSDENLYKIGKEILNFKKDSDNFLIHFKDYLNYIPREEEYRLINLEFSKGHIRLDKHKASRLVSEYVFESIMKTRVDRKGMPKMFLFFADELKKQYGRKEIPLELGPVDSKYFPPCVRKILYELENAEVTVAHQPRFVIATFLANIGMSMEKALDVFRGQPNWNERRTRYYLEHAYGEKGGRVKYTVPGCSKMDSYGLCYRDNTCLWRSPLTYYRKRKGFRSTRVSK